MEQTHKTTARDFFLNLGVVVSLFTVIGGLINLLFTVIDKAYPPVAQGYVGYTAYSISAAVSTIVVFFPIFIFLSWLLARDFATQPEKKNTGIHKWLTYITLFITGLSGAVDLVIVLTQYLGGHDITTSFVLKAGAVLVLSILVFVYYLLNIIRTLSSTQRMMWRIGAAVIVVGSIIWGFSVLGSPYTQRLLNQDGQRVSDIQTVNNWIMSYLGQKSTLPLKLEDINKLEAYAVLPVDPVTKEEYVYVKTGEDTYQICATFAKASDVDPSRAATVYSAPYAGQIYGGHPEGYYCYSFTAKGSTDLKVQPL